MIIARPPFLPEGRVILSVTDRNSVSLLCFWFALPFFILYFFNFLSRLLFFLAQKKYILTTLLLTTVIITTIFLFSLLLFSSLPGFWTRFLPPFCYTLYVILFVFILCLADLSCSLTWLSISMPLMLVCYLLELYVMLKPIGLWNVVHVIIRYVNCFVCNYWVEYPTCYLFIYVNYCHHMVCEYCSKYSKF